MNRTSILRSILPIALVTLAAPAFAEDVTGTLQLSGQVMPGCQLQINSMTDIELASLPGTGAFMVSSAIGVLCNTGTAYDISAGDGLSYGLNPNYPNHRSLAGPGYYLPYTLHKDEMGGLPWGQGADQISGVGSGEWQNLPYSVVFLDGSKAPSGFYSDDIQVTLTY